MEFIRKLSSIRICLPVLIPSGIKENNKEVIILFSCSLIRMLAPRVSYRCELRKMRSDNVGVVVYYAEPSEPKIRRLLEQAADRPDRTSLYPWMEDPDVNIAHAGPFSRAFHAHFDFICRSGLRNTGTRCCTCKIWSRASGSPRFSWAPWRYPFASTWLASRRGCGVIPCVTPPSSGMAARLVYHTVRLIDWLTGIFSRFYPIPSSILSSILLLLF